MISISLGDIDVAPSSIDWIAPAIALATIFITHWLTRIVEGWKSNRTLKLRSYQEFLTATTDVTVQCNHPEIGGDLTLKRANATAKYIELLVFCSPSVEKAATKLIEKNRSFEALTDESAKAAQNHEYWCVRDAFIHAVRAELGVRGKISYPSSEGLAP